MCCKALTDRCISLVALRGCSKERWCKSILWSVNIHKLPRACHFDGSTRKSPTSVTVDRNNLDYRLSRNIKASNLVSFHCWFLFSRDLPLASHNRANRICLTFLVQGSQFYSWLDMILCVTPSVLGLREETNIKQGTHIF